MTRSISLRSALFLLILLSLSSLSLSAQNKTVNLKDFSFTLLANQVSNSNPLDLPFTSKSPFIELSIEEESDYGSVQEFLDEYTRFIRKYNVQTINGTSIGSVVERSTEQANTFILTGMVRNNISGAALLVEMRFQANNKVSESNALFMLRSFRSNAGAKPVTPVSPVNPAPVTNPANNRTPGNGVDVARILADHNKYRSALGIPGLTWSNELAAVAQRWANHLAIEQGCRFFHSSSEYGENLSMGSGASHNFTDAIEGWAAERKDFNYTTKQCNGNWAKCGHYTQIIWKSTTKVGCASAKCANGSIIIVCNYDPAGNMMGETPY